MLITIAGLKANTTTYFCVECDANFCSNCQSSHAIQHASHIVRHTQQPWSQSMPALAEISSCSECSLEVRCRFECSTCSNAICYECYEFTERRVKLYQHRVQHGKGTAFIEIFPPTYSVVPPIDHECDCLRATGCLSHCGKCFRCAYISSLWFHSVCVSKFRVI